MADEKIILPDFLIADLYKSALVDLPVSTPNKATDASPKEELVTVNTTPETEVPDKIVFLGENKKGVSIIVEERKAVFLAEEDLTFLTNILKACQLTLADISIINIASQEISYEAIKQQLQSQYFLLFDVEPSALKLPFMIPSFQVQNFGGSTIMVAPSLPYLNKPTQDGKLLKTKLWLSLKQVFNLP